MKSVAQIMKEMGWDESSQSQKSAAEALLKNLIKSSHTEKRPIPIYSHTTRHKASSVPSTEEIKSLQPQSTGEQLTFDLKIKTEG